MKKIKADKNSQTCPFIDKLVSLLQNQSLYHIVSWSPTQDSFVIKNVAAFQEEVLPIYFKHQKISSFVRQLNMYDFKKIKIQEYDNVYTHPNFIKGNLEFLKQIKRKTQKKKKTQEDQEHHQKKEQSLLTIIERIENRQLQIEQSCSLIHTQHAELAKQNQKLLKIIKRSEQERQQAKKKFDLFFKLYQEKSERMDDQLRGQKANKIKQSKQQNYHAQLQEAVSMFDLNIFQNYQKQMFDLLKYGTQINPKVQKYQLMKQQQSFEKMKQKQLLQNYKLPYKSEGGSSSSEVKSGQDGFLPVEKFLNLQRNPTAYPKKFNKKQK